jgi:hypothetical protein
VFASAVTKQSAMPCPEPIRGRQVTILAGKYFINNGAWINEAEGDGGFTAKSVYVLVKLKDKLVGTRLQKYTVSYTYKARIESNNYDDVAQSDGGASKNIAKHNIEDVSVYVKEFLKMLTEAQQVSPYRTTFNAPARK